MSTQLPIVDLSAATVGSTGTISLANVGPTANPAFTLRNATLQAFNESGAGLSFAFRDTGGGVYLPAGGWQNIAIPAGESTVDYKVLYVLSGAIIKSLFLTYYAVTEEQPTGLSLGNSPVNVSSINITNQVAQFGLPAPSFVVEASNLSSSEIKLQLNNDGSAKFGDQVTGPILSIDNTGNLIAQALSASTVPVLTTTNQEFGHYFTQFVAPSTVVWSFWVTFKSKMTNVPTITLSTTTNVNCTSTTSHVTLYGFRLDVTPTGAGTTSVDTDWTTVGN